MPSIIGKHKKEYLSLKIVCSSRTWSFILIIFSWGPKSWHTGGFSSGGCSSPLARSAFSEVTLDFPAGLESLRFLSVSFSSLEPTNSGIFTTHSYPNTRFRGSTNKSCVSLGRASVTFREDEHRRQYSDSFNSATVRIDKSSHYPEGHRLGDWRQFRNALENNGDLSQYFLFPGSSNRSEKWWC